MARRELVDGTLQYAVLKPLEVIATMAVTQTLVTAAGIAAYETIGGRTVSADKVTARASESINGILGELANELQKISAAGKLEVLIERIRNIVFEHTGRFTNEYANVGLDVVTNVVSQTFAGVPIGYGLGSAIGAVPGITQMLIKNYEAVPHIEEKTKQAIREIAGTINQWQLLEGKFYTTFKDEAEILSQAPVAQGFVIDGVADCSKIQDVQLEAVDLRDPPASYQRDLGTLCLQTNQELIQPRDYERLKSIYIDLVSADLTDTRKDLHKKIGNTAVAMGMEIIDKKYEFSQKMGEKIVGGIDQAFDAIRAGERVEAGGGDTATKVNQPPRGDEAARNGPDSSPSEHLDQTTKDTDTNQLSLVNSLLKNPYGDPLLLYDPFANPFSPLVNPYAPYSQFYWKDIDLVVPDQPSLFDELFKDPFKDLFKIKNPYAQLNWQYSWENADLQCVGGVCGRDVTASSLKFELTTSTPNVLIRQAAEAAYLSYSDEVNRHGGENKKIEKRYERTIDRSDYFNSLKANSFSLLEGGEKRDILNGYHGIAIRGKDNTIFISSEGTSEIRDLLNDIAIKVGIIPPQYYAAEAFAKKNHRQIF